MPDSRCVILGAGVAGVSAVEALREEGFDGGIDIFSDEAVPPYQRPTLSKARLRGNLTDDQIAIHPASSYVEHGIELHLSEPIIFIDAAYQRIVTRHGRDVRYDKLLIATGAVARTLEINGSDFPSVHYLRTLWDCTLLNRSLSTRPRVVIQVTLVGRACRWNMRWYRDCCDLCALARPQPLSLAH